MVGAQPKQLYLRIFPDFKYSLVVTGKVTILCSETEITSTEIRTIEPPALVNGLGLGFWIRIRVRVMGLGL